MSGGAGRHLSVDDAENWVAAEDSETGRPYWVNQRTRETSWTPPAQLEAGGTVRRRWCVLRV
jgi:hypothetical protein